MTEVSTARINVLRATYLFIAVGLGAVIGPRLLFPPDKVAHMTGVVWSVLGAVGLLALLGIRHPLKMLPLLFFELAWKTIWIIVIWLPLWLGDRVDVNAAATMRENLLGVVLIPLVVPWGYVIRQYLRTPGDRWRTSKVT